MHFYFSKHFFPSNPLSQSLEPAPLSFQKNWHLSEIEILKMESPKSYLNSLKSLVFRQILRKLSEFRWNNVYLAFFVKFLLLDIQETKVINLILSLEECTVTTDFKRSSQPSPFNDIKLRFYARISDGVGVARVTIVPISVSPDFSRLRKLSAMICLC